MANNIEVLIGNLVSIEGSWAVFRFQETEYNLARAFIPAVFLSSLQQAALGSKVSLVQTNWEKERNELYPQLIVLFPDYLLDVSAVSECMREYGSHPYYYFINRLERRSNTAPILLGNVANFFLDICLHTSDINQIVFKEVLQSVFQMYAVELSDCEDLKKRESEIDFFEKLQLHFEHLKSIVGELFPQKKIDKKNIVVEPSFICPSLGLQGRLDVFEKKEKGISTVIELKSGRTPYDDPNHTAISLNHQTQASLYQIIVQQVLGIPYSKLQTYICYSKCDKNDNPLRLAFPSMQLIGHAIEIRNQIVLLEHNIVHRQLSVESFFKQISPEKMIHSDSLTNKLVSRFIVPNIEHFTQPISNSSQLERAYFFAFYRFLVEEQYLSKCGLGINREKSMSALWATDASEKIKNGTLIEDLRILDIQFSGDNTIVSLQHFQEKDSLTVADFREGDSIVLYAKNENKDNVTNHQIFKGSILEMSNSMLRLRLRNRQQNNALLIVDSYAMEHDVLDNNFTSQFRGLYQFLSASQSRKDIVLGNAKPQSISNKINISTTFLPEIISLIEKVNNAQDLFLLVGPPGTGKTSIALKSFVSYFYDDGQSILLMAYTNRAVDEICMALESISAQFPYVRLGSHINCPERFRERLLNAQVKPLKSRKEVRTFIQNCRIFVGTAAAIAARPELLAQKYFDMAIVDEASQILEPLFLSTWSAKRENKTTAIGKFVLIGDIKQLPAVVCQEDGHFDEEILKVKGIVSGKMSFFERMYRQYKNDSSIVGYLNKQGRMHPEIANFPNLLFYENKLQTIPLSHQLSKLEWDDNYVDNSFKKILHHRLGYLSVPFQDPNVEAQLVAQFANAIWNCYRHHNKIFHEEKTLGIIAPFRSQIARIRKALSDLKNDDLNKVVVDTVERFQGSQRDIIIFSFSVYDERQLQQLTETVTVIDDILVDRKMNVALTRAREQFFLVGNDFWVEKNHLYRRLKQALSAE